MALTVQQQLDIQGALKRYFDALGASIDNQAAFPATNVAKVHVRTLILGPTLTFISDDKFWCLFDEMVSYVIASARMTNDLLMNVSGQQLNGAAFIEALHSTKRAIGM